MKYNKILLLLPLLISCNSNTNQIINEKNVKNYRLNYNVTYTGMLKNGKPDGEGTFKYRNNDTLTTFIVNGQVDNTKDSTHKIMSSKDKFIGKISLDDNYNISYIEGTYDYGVGVNVYTGKFKAADNGNPTIRWTAMGSGQTLYIDSVSIEIQKGDLNKDGEINSTDLVLLRKVLLNVSGLTYDATEADVNKDGEIDIRDLVALKSLIS